MKNLANTTILITEATTNVNGKENKSRITGMEVLMGSVIFEREDGIFFEKVTIAGSEFRPFFRFSNSTIELSPSNQKMCSITIDQWEPK